MRRQFHQRAFRTRTSLKRLEKRLISRSKRHCDEPSFFFRGVQHGPPFTYYLQFQLYSTLLLQAPPHRKVRNWISVENSIEYSSMLSGFKVLHELNALSHEKTSERGVCLLASSAPSCSWRRQQEFRANPTRRNARQKGPLATGLVRFFIKDLGLPAFQFWLVFAPLAQP